SEFVLHLVQAMLDYMRRKKAVHYLPFADYLSAGASQVQQKIARPNNFNKKPIGFAPLGKDMKGAYQVYSWESPRSAILDLLCRTLAWNTEKTQAFIADIMALLLQAKYLRQTKIGQLSGGRANLTCEAYQLVPKYLEVTTQGTFFRCDRCGDVRGYQLHEWSNPGVSVCPAWHCRGKTKPYSPPADNFYVQSYRDQSPERMYVVEHSGQLEEKEREEIEKYFKD